MKFFKNMKSLLAGIALQRIVGFRQLFKNARLPKGYKLKRIAQGSAYFFDLMLIVRREAKLHGIKVGISW